MSARWHEELDAHCERFLGPCPAVLHEIVSDDLHLDLHPHGPTPARQWRTLRTGGMSLRPMVVPDGFHERSHAELIAYLPPAWNLEDDEAWWPGWMLKHLARFVHNERTWFAPGHTIALADPGEVFADHTLFAGVILLAPKVEPRAFDRLVIDGVRCRFLWACPITAAEMDAALERGSDALRQLMAEAGLSHVIDPARACLMTARSPQ